MEQSAFDRENSKRIKSVERTFGVSGKTLSRPGRFLVGQGHLMKQGRRRPQTKAFFLFNDILAYGSVILSGHLHRNLTIIPLEDIKMDFTEDNEEMTKQWLIRTPRKSFFVSAHSQEEKKAWIEQIKVCQEHLLQAGGLQSSAFAMEWVPDQVAHKCMRCFSVFTTTKRRHHCRKCGFLVCNACSKQRMLIKHIHATKKMRICRICHIQNKKDELMRHRGDSAGKDSLAEDD